MRKEKNNIINISDNLSEIHRDIVFFVLLILNTSAGSDENVDLRWAPMHLQDDEVQGVIEGDNQPWVSGQCD